jgi:NADP-dependent 3-hydroxy acid dehydrogenase YdfG
MRRRNVLITGASRGIGETTAELLAERHHLIIGGRDAQAVSDLVTRLPSAEPFIADLTKESEVHAALADIGPVDAVIHCAGALWMGPTDSFTKEMWAQAFDINVIAAATLTTSLLPQLRAARGDVVFMNSGSGLYTYPGGSVYCASKFALKAYADVLREEERANGIRVTSIHPGHVDTDMQRALREGNGDEYDGSQYLRPDSVAKAIQMAIESSDEAGIETVVIRPRQPLGQPWKKGNH